MSGKNFELISHFKPTGDQPEAIRQLTEGIFRGEKAQVLLGVTGSGKTFTIANVIRNIGKPVLILSHNKTLAAQLYQEFKSFFPHNAVEYYVSYYDYYQPEAYIPATGKYIEKELQINDEIDKLRISATSALLSGRKDVIVVSSVSCIYGMGNPSAFYEKLISIKVGQHIGKNKLERDLVSNLYTRNDLDLTRGFFRVKGDTIDIALAYSDYILRVQLWGEEIDSIQELDSETFHTVNNYDTYKIYPANLFITSDEIATTATKQIEDDLWKQEQNFRNEGKFLEAERLHERVTYDIQMIRELGHCSGIENYSRYFDGRKPGTRPYCLLDFFPKDFLLVVDESHVTIGQVSGMYGGDRSRKENLVEYGYRLPAAFDNRPLKFTEFKELTNQTIYISATPADYELNEAGGVVIEQLIRPTGLLDPKIVVRQSENQIDDLIEEITIRKERDERVLITTISKQSAEDLTEYLLDSGIKVNYIHSDVDTLDRIKILNSLRKGDIDVLVGVNLLREGLDLPEVSLVAILDADKSGFLRDTRSLTQTAGRAARNVNGLVIMYGDSVSSAMKEVIEESERRRSKQIAYNKLHNITPSPIKKAVNTELTSDNKTLPYINMLDTCNRNMVAEEESIFGIDNETEDSLKLKMEKAAKDFDFILAAKYRDELLKLKANK